MNGIHDQIVALQWVHQHAALFGADPQHITIFVGQHHPTLPSPFFSAALTVVPLHARRARALVASRRAR